jgi:hypothetical protein
VTTVPIDHGTPKGDGQHRARSEDPCQPCRDAWNAYLRDYRATHPDCRTRDLKRSKARHRALTRLAKAHPGEFLQLVGEELAALEKEAA